MKTNHLNTASKYIEKQITKLQNENEKIVDKAEELMQRSDVIHQQIKALQATKKSLVVENGAGDDYPIIDLKK